MTDRFCRCHCRSCGGHFTSLAAFDAHRPGPCEYPDTDAKGKRIEWVEMQGVCAISEPPERFPGTLYGLPANEWVQSLRQERLAV